MSLRTLFERMTDKAVQSLPTAGSDLLIKRLADRVVIEDEAVFLRADQPRPDRGLELRLDRIRLLTGDFRQ